MPGLPHKNLQSGTGPVFLNGIWSNHHGHVSFDQIQKFWNELSHTARQRLLRIDKQTLFEQIRKNLYCSRCNGLLLEAFSQIVLYGKSLQLDGAVHISSKPGSVKKQIDTGSGRISSNREDDVQDPSVHPWGGLIASRDGILTLLDCFLYGESLEALQNVFDSARARERECELLYPDACGGGGRGWMSQGMASCGRGHGNRESCALHTARLSCDTLVDFWSALGDETRQSLLQMKEEDFIERLMYRFESKRFCRDCRRNVIREFKELKELKRMRRETRCTDWFCVADSAFQYEVSEDTVQADWHQSFTDAVGMYHHFEWAVGTGEGKSDILEFENVGTNGSVLVNGLDLGGLSACFITLRAWKIDGRFNEFTVKAHSLKGQSCVHRRLTVGDGFATITKGESIRSFFECAEEVEEEEDDDSSDKDGNEPDGDGFRSQRHAKSPELAREFLLDAATVIFKDQVEKAFREGTARQNAHSTFVCLTLKLLEERVHVACKEIITLEKQIKLLEEEENEKREEEERKERRRTKERERKLRRKERLKEKEREKNCMGPKQLPIASQSLTEDMAPSAEEEQHCTSNLGESMNETGDIMPVSTLSSDIVDEDSINECINLQSLENSSSHHTCDFIGEINVRDGSFVTEQLKHSRQKTRFRKDSLADPAPNWCERHHFISSIEGGFLVDEDDSKLQGCVAASSKYMNGPQRQSRNNSMKHNARNYGPKFGEKFHFSNNRMRDRYDFHSCSYNSLADYRSKDGQPTSVIRSGRVFRTENSKKHNYGSYVMDKCGVRRAKHVIGKILPARDVLPTKKVWEPTESRKRYPRSKSDLDVSLMSSASNTCDGNGNVSPKANGILNSCDEPFSSELSENLGECGGLSNCQSHEESASDPLVSTSGSDNCSSCVSEGDSSIQVTESPLTSDSDVASQQSEGREISSCNENAIHNCPDVAADEKCKTSDRASLTGKITSTHSEASCLDVKQSIKYAHSSDNSRIAADTDPQQNPVLPIHNQSVHVPVFPAPSALGYYRQTASWAAAPNGLMPLPLPNNYIYPNSFGYGLSTNWPLPFCMQYCALQPLASAVPTVSQLPFYRTCSSTKAVNLTDQAKSYKLGEAQEDTSVATTTSSEIANKKPFPNEQPLQRTPPVVQDGHVGNTARSQNDNSAFSLFHFGGPLSVSCTEHNPKAVSSKDVPGEFSSNLPGDGCSSQVDLSGTERDKTIEEYSLFSATNGVQFSFF